jgi:SSS family solute:Na+ symporter
VSAPFVALAIIASIVLGTIAFALIAIRRVTMDPQQFIVGGRSFGTFFLWVLLAGEVYTSFTFLGAAGWAYGRGAPAFYILAYGTVAYVLGYFLLPEIWRVGKDRGLLTSPDFLADRYDSKWLGIAAGLLQFVLVVPYVTLQLTGLQLLLSLAGYGMYNATLAVCVAFLLVAGFVFTAGLRGTAWASLIKDVLVLGAVVFAGIVIPMHFFGSPAAVFERVAASHPGWFTLRAGSADHGVNWFVSTVLLTSIGFYMGPHSIAATYSARSASVLRRNAIFLPLYQLVMLLVFFAGLAALIIVPGLKGPDADQSFMLVVQRYYPPWVMGLVAGAGALAALIPASALLLGAASVFAKNVLSDGFNLATSDRARTAATRALVLVIAVFALVLWLVEKKSLVELLLIYYNGITQFVPGFVFAFAWKRVSATAIAAGLAGGLLLAIYLTTENITPWGINPGFLALLLNIAIVVATAFAAPRRQAT